MTASLSRLVRRQYRLYSTIPMPPRDSAPIPHDGYTCQLARMESFLHRDHGNFAIVRPEIGSIPAASSLGSISWTGSPG
ncbi:hypothetical protein TgHK011_009039 [Trichoderma gracile]|nr:hypothetical protein TgHK011_009039 [Trichoderma gracile]